MIYNPDNLKTCVDTIESRCAVSLSPNDCPVCSAIPNHCYRDLAAHEGLWPKEIESLVRVLGLIARPDCIRQCLNCGQCYEYSYHYTYLNGASEEEEELQKLQKGEVLGKIIQILQSYVQPKVITPTQHGFEIEF